MATGQTLLDLMEVLHQELQLQPTEADVARGLVALNAAQDYFEAQAAQTPGLLGDTVGTITTAADTETTTFPSGVLRLDGMQMLGTNSRPQYDMRPASRAGGHAFSQRWPYYLFANTATGKPTEYWTNGRSVYWSPVPNDTYTVRWYGLQAASDITAGGTFAYPDIVMLPLASFATTLIREGLQDDPTGLASLAQGTFAPVLLTLGNFERGGGSDLIYTETHEA